MSRGGIIAVATVILLVLIATTSIKAAIIVVIVTFICMVLALAYVIGFLIEDTIKVERERKNNKD